MRETAASQLSDALSAVDGTTDNAAALEIRDGGDRLRVQLGALGGGDYGLKVTSSDGSTVIIDGTSNMFKILASGTVSVSQTNPGGTVSDTTLTGLGAWTTIPICISGVSFSNTLTGNVRQLAREFTFIAQYVAASSGGSPTVLKNVIDREASVGSYVVGTDAGIRIGLSTYFGTPGQNTTAYGRYQLCQEASL
jgi:hypothetical protein